MRDLLEETKYYRNKKFKDLNFVQKKTVKRLNRLYLKDIYNTNNDTVPNDRSKELHTQWYELVMKYLSNNNSQMPLFDIPNNRIQGFNQWTKIPDFYDTLEIEKRDKKRGFFSIINRLVKETEDYRRKEFCDLNDQQQEKIKKLNRLLIEEMFSDDCPKSKHGNRSRLFFACFGMPTVILIFLFAGALWFLLSRDTFTENERKNLGRFAVSLIGWTALTTALFAVTIFGREISGKIVIVFQSVATFAWVNIMVAISALLQRFIPLTEGKGAKWSFKIAIALGMCIIIAGAIILSAWFPHVFQLDQTDSYKKLGIVFCGSLAIAFLMSWGMNINSLSLHTLYKDRLKRAYLGIFKQDDKSSGLKIDKILENSYDGPYPIINATLNLTNGEELAWQQRKAASFVFTPLHYGYKPHHRHTSEENEKDLEKGVYRSWKDANGGDKPFTFTLGDAMAISGAAASPNMGYRSSGALAFILTVFNVRLGRWFGNPKCNEKHAGPGWQGLWYLLKELFGRSDDRGRYVYLSDGGHFENLGIYELVRRRCRYIVACDAGEDPDMEFGDLANAIEKCRADFGINISINVERMKKNKESGISGSHYAIGTIEYEKVDPDPARNGVLVYIKSSLTGDESMDIKSYKTQNESFPHQTTLDQLFDESQFEAYRTLGYHVINKIFGSVSQETRNSKDARKIFNELNYIYQLSYHHNIGYYDD